MKNSSLEPTKDLLNQKKNYLKTNNITSLLEKKSNDIVPYIFPVNWIHQNKFGNNSEKNRFEKFTDLFLKLRVYFEENPDNEIIIAKEFLNKHGIYEKEFFDIDKLGNFINFIKGNSCLKINPLKTLKEIIIDALQDNDEEEKDTFIDLKKKKNFKGGNLYHSYTSRGNQFYKAKNKPSTANSFNNSKNFNNSENSFNNKPNNKKNNNLHHILNEKLYKIEFDNPQAVIDNLEPEIAKIKGLSINPQEKIEKNFTKSINQLKKMKNITNEVSTNGYLQAKDFEQLKKKNKLLEYIILQRSKNRLKLENDKKVFEIDYNGSKEKNYISENSPEKNE